MRPVLNRRRSDPARGPRRPLDERDHRV